MQYCVDHPEEISKLENLAAQVSEVQGIMRQNIDKVLDRGEKLKVLVVNAEDLRAQMKRIMCLANMKIKLIVLGIIIPLVLFIVLSVCKGFNCGK
ncbi:hypothetical protein ACHQM5_029589 [Ranunculus cassubicifolius]